MEEGKNEKLGKIAGAGTKFILPRATRCEEPSAECERAAACEFGPRPPFPCWRNARDRPEARKLRRPPGPLGSGSRFGGKASCAVGRARFHLRMRFAERTWKVSPQPTARGILRLSPTITIGRSLRGASLRDHSCQGLGSSLIQFLETTELEASQGNAYIPAALVLGRLRMPNRNSIRESVNLAPKRTSRVCSSV